jgi:HTH-type transcriptional regulator, competence development regulator
MKKILQFASRNLSSHHMARRKKATYTATSQRLGEWLRGLREAKDLPLRVVAAAAEMDQAHLSKVELGQRLLTAEQSNLVAKFFGIDANEFEARRIVERFRLDHADNPAVEQAINMLHEDPVIYGGKK